MLRTLQIRSLALIDDLALSFGPGLNVITGETGAGKSLLTRALSIAAGYRAGTELIRAGASALEVEGEFETTSSVRARLAEAGIPLAGDDVDATLLVRRTVTRGGRGQVALNDRSATLGLLTEIGGALVHVYGQHDYLRLIEAESHLAMLDSASGTESRARDLRAQVACVGELIARLDGLERSAVERARHLEMARFDLDELTRARLVGPDEEAELLSERDRCKHAARLSEVVSDGIDRLYAGESASLGAIERIARRLAELSRIDAALGEIASLLDQAAAPLGEATHLLSRYLDTLRDDPARLDAIEDRLALLDRLKRKHAVDSIAGLLDKQKILELECGRAEGDAADPQALRNELAREADHAWTLARALSVARAAGARDLAARMDLELAELGMAGARFSVVFEPLPAGSERGAGAVLTRDGISLGPDGVERVEFFLAANEGEGARQLARVASGGELSRIMLGLRTVAGGEAAPTLIFDEVDAGIGGQTAEIVGRRMRALARRHQIICITHLAQIAAFADHHYAVAKRTERGRTQARATLVRDAARAAELARMLGGRPSEPQALQHAEAMLERANSIGDVPRGTERKGGRAEGRSDSGPGRGKAGDKGSGKASGKGGGGGGANAERSVGGRAGPGENAGAADAGAGRKGAAAGR